MLEFIDQGPDSLVALSEAMAEVGNKRPPGLAIPSENGFLLAPIPVPRKNIFGIGLNYVEHVAESARSLESKQPKYPLWQFLETLDKYAWPLLG